MGAHQHLLLPFRLCIVDCRLAQRQKERHFMCGPDWKARIEISLGCHLGRAFHKPHWHSWEEAGGNKASFLATQHDN